ncbi:MAG: hypothetical protein JW818_13625 [Pirellulales bacterium]|nr:hypothetical protein [Pirellulales bacterium]
MPTTSVGMAPSQLGGIEIYQTTAFEEWPPSQVAVKRVNPSIAPQLSHQPGPNTLTTIVAPSIPTTPTNTRLAKAKR